MTNKSKILDKIKKCLALNIVRSSYEKLFEESKPECLANSGSPQQLLEQLNKAMNQWYKEGKLGTPEYDQLVNKINEIESLLKPQSQMDM